MSASKTGRDLRGQAQAEKCGKICRKLNPTMLSQSSLYCSSSTTKCYDSKKSGTANFLYSTSPGVNGILCFFLCSSFWM
ncbi:unnamed protein product [Arctogadus glacialis]